MAKEQQSQFFKACAEGDIASMEKLFTNAALSMTDADGKNAMHFAAMEGRADAVEWLVHKGFAVDSLNKKGLTPFHFAVNKGHRTAAALLQAAGCDTTLADATGRTPLLLACVAGSLDIVQWLLEECGASIEEVNSEGMGPAHFAAFGGHLALLEWLASHGLPMESPTHSGMTCMHLAAVRGHVEVVQWLASPPPDGAGLPLSTGDLKKRTPLHVAAASGQAEVVRYLLEHGADPRQADADGKSTAALVTGLIAAKGTDGGLGKVQDLLAAATNVAPAPPAPCLLSQAVAEELSVLVAEDEPVPGEGEPLAPKLPAPGYGTSTTRAWVRWEAPDVPPAGKPALEYSLQVAPRIQARMGMGWVDASLVAMGPVSSAWGEVTASVTPHTFACISGLAPGNGYSVRVRARNVNGWGQYSKPEEVQTDKDKEKDKKGEEKKTEEADGGDKKAEEAAQAPAPPPAPVVIEPTLTARAVDAASRGDVSALEAAEAEGEDVKGIDDKGRTILHHAASTGALATLKWGLAKGLPVDGRDKVGATALLLAVVSGFLPGVRALAVAGASVDACDLKGYSALHYAALKQRVAIFRWLCEAGADPSVRNSKGQTVRAVIESKLSPPSGQPGPTKEETAACQYMMSLLVNAENVPTAPPVPSLVDSTRYSLLLSLTPAKWVAGCPCPFCLRGPVHEEIRHGVGHQPLLSTVSDSLPTGINIHAADYLVQVPGAAPGQGAAAAKDGASAAAQAEGGADTPGAGQPSGAPSTPKAGPGLYQPVVMSIAGLQPDAKYVAQVRARNARGWGPWSTRSGDLATKASSDKHVPKPEALQAANASQVAATLITSELTAAGVTSKGAAGASGTDGRIRVPPALYHRPSEILFDPEAAGVQLPTATADGAAEDSTRADGQATPAAAVASDYVHVEAVEEEGASIPNPIIRAARQGKLLALANETGPTGRILQAARQRLLAVAGKGLAQPSALSAWLEPLTVPSGDAAAQCLVDSDGVACTAQTVLIETALAASQSGSTKALHWLVGGQADEDLASPAAADSTAPPALPPAEARALQLLNTACCRTDIDSRGLVHAAALGGHVSTLRFVLAGMADGGDGQGQEQDKDNLRARLATALAEHVGHSGAGAVHLAAFGGVHDCLGWLLSLQVHRSGAADLGSPLATRAAAETASGALAADTANGWTPVHYAAAGGSATAVRMLLQDLGAGAGAKDKGGRTAAHLAAAADAAAVLAEMSSLGHTDLLNSQDEGGMQPLHYAALSESPLAAAFLLACGAGSVKATDAAGRTAVDVAMKAGSAHTAALLQGWDGQTQTWSLAPAAVAAVRATGSSSGVTVTWRHGRQAALYHMARGNTAVMEALEATVAQLGPLSDALSRLEAESATVPVRLEWTVARPGLTHASSFMAAGLALEGGAGKDASEQGGRCGSSTVPPVGPMEGRARIERLAGVPTGSILVRAVALDNTHGPATSNIVQLQ